MIQVVPYRRSRPTARILERLVQSKISTTSAEGSVRQAYSPDSTGYVSYGVPVSQRPALNANAGRLDKLQQGQRLAERGVPVVRHWRHGDVATPPLPMLGRRLNHRGGTDIMVVLESLDIPLRAAAGAEFFTEFVPSTREFRVWIYRRRHLGTYEKWLAYPEKYRGIGRNYDNGWAFRLVPFEQVPRLAVDVASKAIEALDLDFGAVDILQKHDGSFVVLEVNTAPGVDDEGRFAIRNLANRIARWHDNGFPRRRGDGAGA